MLLAITGCHASGPRRAESAAEGSLPRLRMQMPASLADRQAEYAREVPAAQGEVSAFFRGAGFELPTDRLVDTVVVFDESSAARVYLANVMGAAPERIPATFAGTVDGQTLLLVSREVYHDIWTGLYPDWPWTDTTYHELIVHELTHQAHELLATKYLGGPDAMGPSWFFEGLAVACAGQFKTDEPLWSAAEIPRQLGPDGTPPVSYPSYGRLVRSLSGQFTLHELISRAGQAEFPGSLWSKDGGE